MKTKEEAEEVERMLVDVIRTKEKMEEIESRRNKK